MIEKLKVVMKPEDWKLPVNELEMRCLKNLLLKVDELVDAVNAIQGDVKKTNSPTKNVRDEYAEQRKWIGKLCWFWGGNIKKCGILTAVLDNNKYGEDDPIEEYPFQRDSIGCWQHCEPVKPDDDIIYKGGDNER